MAYGTVNVPGKDTTYKLEKTGNTIKLTGSDGSSSTVADSNTTYGNASAAASGLMSKEDKAKLDSHTEDTDIHVTAAEKAKWNAGTGGGDAMFDPMVTVNAYKLDANGAAADQVVEDIYFDETEGFLHLYEGTGIRLTGYTPAGAVPQRKGIKLELNMEEIIAAFPDASEVSY